MTRQTNRILWDQWRRRIERQRESGLSIAEFCRRENLSAQQCYVWKRKLREATRRREPRTGAKSQRNRRPNAAVAPRRPARRDRVGLTASPLFLQLPTAITPSTLWIELTTADGAILRLPPQNLAALIAALRVLRGEPLESPSGDGRHA